MAKFIEYTEFSAGTRDRKLVLVNTNHVQKAVYREKSDTLTLHLCCPGEKPSTVDLDGEEAKIALKVLQELQ